MTRHRGGISRVFIRKKDVFTGEVPNVIARTVSVNPPKNGYHVLDKLNIPYTARVGVWGRSISLAATRTAMD